jgi:hypothetical protein
MSHITLPEALVLLVLGVLVAAAIIAAGPGKRGPSRRFVACLLAGLILGGFVVEWVGRSRHAQVAAAAAASHMSAANIRADALLACTAGLAVVLFAITTAVQRKAARARPRPLPAPRRRAGAVR